MTRSKTWCSDNQINRLNLKYDKPFPEQPEQQDDEDDGNDIYEDYDGSEYSKDINYRDRELFERIQGKQWFVISNTEIDHRSSRVSSIPPGSQILPNIDIAEHREKFFNNYRRDLQNEIINCKKSLNKRNHRPKTHEEPLNRRNKSYFKNIFSPELLENYNQFQEYSQRYHMEEQDRLSSNSNGSSQYMDAIKSYRSQERLTTRSHLTEGERRLRNIKYKAPEKRVILNKNYTLFGKNVNTDFSKSKVNLKINQSSITNKIDFVNLNRGFFVNKTYEYDKSKPPVNDISWHKTLNLQKIKLLDKRMKTIEPMTIRDYFNGKTNTREIWLSPIDTNKPRKSYKSTSKSFKL